MEGIVRKLNKNKPFLVHNAYNKLLSLMLDKKKCGTKFTRQAEEIVLLKDQCLSPNLATSQGACNTLVACVKHDLLTAQDVQTVLISMSAHNKNLFQILSAILSLHKPLGNVSEQCVDGNKSASPLVMVMKQCVGAWKPLLDIIDVSSSSHTWRLHSLDYYLPIFHHILCARNVQLPLVAKQSAWQLLAKLTTRGPRVRILLEHFVCFQSSTPNNLTEAITFLSQIYEGVIATTPSYSGLLLLCSVHMLLVALENNVDTGLLWRTIQDLTTKVLSYRLSPSSNADIVKLTMLEVVPVTILILVQCIPHCDGANLKPLLSTSQTLIRYFSINPTLYCSYLMPLLPWLSTLPAVPGNSATNPPDQRNDHKSDKNSKDFCRSDIPSSQIDSSVGDSGIRNSVSTSDELKSDLHEFIQMIVNSLKPPAPTPVIDSKEPQRTPWVIERSDTEESEGDEFSDLVYCFSDDWADFGMEEEQEDEDEEEEDYRYENRDVYVRSPVRTEENDFDTDDSADRDKDVEMKEVKSPSKTASDGASSHKDTPMTTDTPVVQEKPSTATLKAAEESGIASSSIKIEEKSPEENGNKELMAAESDLIEKQLKTAVSKNDTKDQKETLSPQKNLIAGIPGPSLDPYRSPNTYMSEHRQIRTEETRHYLDMHNRPEPLHPNASNLNQNVTNTQSHSNIPQQTSKGVAQGQVRLNIPGNPQPLPGHGQNLMLNPQISTHVGNLRNQNASNIPLGNQPHPYFPTNVQLANNPNQNVPVRNPWNPLQNVPILNRPQPTYNYPVPNHINPYLRHPEFNKNEAIADKQVLDEIDETTAFWGRGEVEKEKDRDRELAEWEEVRRVMFSTNERVMVAQSLVRKLNAKPVESWDTKFGEFPATAYLASGFLCRIYLFPIDRFQRILYLNNDQDIKALNFLISQDPASAIYLILFLLARELDCQGIQHWLENLVNTAQERDNIPLILNTLESLRRVRDPALTTYVITLYTRLFEIEPRTFPFLLPLLTENKAGIKQWVFDTLRAHTVGAIQKTKPEIYGKELVPLLSSILSTYTDAGSTCTPPCLALGAIRELCQVGVVDFASIWSSLRVLKDDYRPRFLVSFIGLMECVVQGDDGQCANYIPSELEYEISSVLWSYVARNISKEVTHAALCALSRFNFQTDYPLKYLTPALRAGLKIPKSVLGKLHQNSANPEEHVMFIPGECFLNLLDMIDYDSYLPRPRCCLHRYELKGRPIFKTLDWTEKWLEQIANRPIDPYQCSKHNSPLWIKELSKQELTKEEVEELKRESEEEETCEVCQRISHRMKYVPYYEGFVKLLEACIERELKSYKEIIYNSPYQDAAHSREPTDFSYLPYKSVLRALVKFLQAKVQDSSQKFQPQVQIVLQILSKTYSKPLPPLDWSFLIHAYLNTPSEADPALNSTPSETDAPLKPSERIRAWDSDLDESSELKPPKGPDHYCSLSVLEIAAANCGSSAETRHNLAEYLRNSEGELSEVTALLRHLPVLCEHLDSEVFSFYLDRNVKEIVHENSYEPSYYSSDYEEELERAENDEDKYKNMKCTLEQQCTVVDCSLPYAMLQYFKEIRTCFEKFGPGISGVHLPPSSNLEANLLYIANFVTYEFETSGCTETSHEYERYSQYLECIRVMPGPFREHLISPLKQGGMHHLEDNNLTLLNLYLIQTKELALTLEAMVQFLNMEYYDKTAIYRIIYHRIPSMLKNYSSREVVDFILQQVFAFIIKKQGVHASHLIKIVFLCVYSKSSHCQLLETSLENIVRKLEMDEVSRRCRQSRVRRHIENTKEAPLFKLMEPGFPVAFLSMVKPEQYNQAAVLLETIITQNYLTKEYEATFKHILLALRT